MSEREIYWDFTPFQSFPKLEDWEKSKIQFLALRLESFIKYGGPLTDFLKECEAKFEIRVFSDYLPTASARSWDPTHQLATKSFFASEKIKHLICRNSLPEVPPANLAVKDLIENLPKEVDVTLIVSNEPERAALTSRLGENEKVRIEIGEQSAAQQSLLNEFQMLYPRLINAAGGARAERWLQGYEEAFARRDWERFENLRAFPLFLRNENRMKKLDQAWWAELALWEWSEFGVLYSPMDEAHEQKSLKPGELLLNPTAQILRLEFDLPEWFGDGTDAAEEPPREKTMALLYRVKHKSGHYEVKKRSVLWKAAALLDVLLEHGRIHADVYWNEIRSHQGSSDASHWQEDFESLIDAGVILRG